MINSDQGESLYQNYKSDGPKRRRYNFKKGSFLAKRLNAKNYYKNIINRISINNYQRLPLNNDKINQINSKTNSLPKSDVQTPNKYFFVSDPCHLTLKRPVTRYDFKDLDYSKNFIFMIKPYMSII